jgi:hypothetical protein
VFLLANLQNGAKPVSVIERVLAVSWLVLPIGLVVSSAVCGFVLARTPAADTAYKQAVVAHGGCLVWWVTWGGASDAACQHAVATHSG